MTDQGAESRRPGDATPPSPGDTAPPSPEAAATPSVPPPSPDDLPPPPGTTPPPSEPPSPPAESSPPPGATPPPPGATPPGATPPPPADTPPAPGATPPPPGATPPPGDTPPPGGYAGAGAWPPPYAAGGFASRYGLVRPRQGRYIAGVCAAVGRATNTDPVLWRVLLVVLGFFGGVGILVYLAAWLLIPAEGDTASPVESMFGKGRSNTSPILVIVLAVLVALMFGFIVTDGFRAALLGAAVLIGGALLLNRTNNPPTTTAPPAGPPPGPAYPRFGGVTGDVPPPAQGAPFPPGPIPAAPAGPSAEGPSYPLAPPPYPGAAPPGHPAGMPSGGAPPGSGAVPAVGPTDSTITEPLPPMPPAPGQPAGGYRPPFAPHGPYGGAPPPPPPPPPRPPRPPRERSPLGAATLSMVLVALGLVTALDVANVLNPRPSAYFAAALATVALGLLVGAWFGRARWLIALGLVFAAALGISTIAESEDVEGRIRSRGGPVVWTPTGLTELEPRYEHSFGQATLDLTTVDFTDREAEVNVAINAGDLDVILPETVDTTVMLRVRAGDATVFGENYGGVNVGVNRIQDDGTDGPGGGRLVLNLEVNAGDAEVHR